MTKQDLKSLLAAVATAASRKLKINYFPAMLYTRLQALGTRHYTTKLLFSANGGISSPVLLHQARLWRRNRTLLQRLLLLLEPELAVDILYEKKGKREKNTTRRSSWSGRSCSLCTLLATRHLTLSWDSFSNELSFPTFACYLMEEECRVGGKFASLLKQSMY